MRTVACVCALACASLAATAQSATAADRLPDLGMARLLDLRVEKTIGHGRFEARQTSAGSTQVAQRIYDDAGGYRDVATAATFVFGGDGHNHWHVRDLEISDLIRLDNGTKVGTGAKRGFCFYDNYQYNLGLPGAPQSPVYTASACSSPPAMGLSIGWGDIYHWSLPDQYVDITGLGAGRYRLQVTARLELVHRVARRQQRDLGGHPAEGPGTAEDHRLRTNRVTRGRRAATE